MVQAHNITKSFQAQVVLRGVDLSVEKGDVVAILGPSGSGKTTLLRCLNFLETADGGTLEFDGETFQMGQVSKKDIARLRKKTAFVFQSYNLFSNKTALQNVTEGLIIGRGMDKAKAAEIGRRALDKVGLSDRYGYYPHQLSGGQQQRGGMTMLVVTHEMSFARNVSNKVIFMEDGRVLEQCGSREFFENPREERVKAFLQTLRGGV